MNNRESENNYEQCGNLELTIDRIETCEVEEDDVQCGQILFNECSRMLKFRCQICRQVYDNIGYFCNHMSTHINFVEEEPPDEVEPEIIPDHGVAEILEEPANDDGPESVAFYCEEYTSEGQARQTCGEGEIENSYDTPDMIVEQLDDECVVEADVVETDIEADFIETVKTKNCIKTVNKANGYIGEFMAYYENRDNEDAEVVISEDYEEFIENSGSESAPFKYETPEETLINSDSTDFERLIETTTIKEVKPEIEAEPFEENETEESDLSLRSNLNYLKRRSNLNYLSKVRSNAKYSHQINASSQHQGLKKKKKKVTTVKIIAVKNRIAELYEKIKSEEEKRSKQLECNTSNEFEITTDTYDINQQQPLMQQKIIGETIISLIPERQTTVPNSSPETIDKLSNSYKPNKNCVCPACGKVFRSSFSLTIHKRTHYLESKSDIKLAHKCCDCDQLFNKISEMKEHLQKVHYPEGFICKICNKKLTSLTLLESHMRKVHLSRPFNCNICKKNFDNREIFEIHVNAHHVQTQNYKCRICGRKYSTESMLNQHLRRHKEQIPQDCVVCGKKTLRITQHMKIHTPRPKRILSCKVCGKVFNFSSGLSTHFRVMHKYPRPPPKPKPENSNAVKRKRKSQTPRIKVSNQFESLPELEMMPLPQSQPELQPHSQFQSDMITITDDEVTHKEEEAKRVIVEMIQNASYNTSYLPETFVNGTEGAPPIAREETICAVSSIVE